MSKKIFIPEGETAPTSQVGATLEALAATIHARRDADESSWTYQLLMASEDKVLKKVAEEAVEVGLAAKDVEMAMLGIPREAVATDEICQAKVDHLRYEAADVVYHLMVVLERYGISLDEFAAELNNRMTEDERPEGGVKLFERYVKRGK